MPPPQGTLQAAYQERLFDSYGIVFDELYTLANMPIQRFGSMLISKGQFNAYMTTLRSAHRTDNLDGVMCRRLVSVDWQGFIYDCDFNQQLGMAIEDQPGRRLHVAQATAAMLAQRAIRVADHCYGCTAGQGSSCGGALESGAGATARRAAA